MRKPIYHYEVVFSDGGYWPVESLSVARRVIEQHGDGRAGFVGVPSKTGWPGVVKWKFGTDGLPIKFSHET